MDEKYHTEVLLVEDNPGDVRLIKEALRGCESRISLHIVTDGVEALQFLHQEGRYASEPRPDLILLDMHLPRRNGKDVLADISKEEALQQIPVIILTGGETDQTTVDQFRGVVHGILKKPVKRTDFSLIIKEIEAGRRNPG
jgi:chemotaxis family two-component system response regulator Rcp1